MAQRPSLDDYVDVAERIQDFKDAHPEGSLQTIGWEVVTIDGKAFVVYRAAAYRNADDQRPGHGIAWEPFPGRTPYTKDSELMNAETAAWGRAIVALGLVANRKLASRQEVRARMADQEAASAAGEASPAASPATTTTKKPAPSPSATAGSTPGVLDQIRAQFDKSGRDNEWLKWKLVELGVENVDDMKSAMSGLTLDQAVLLFEALGGNVDDGFAGSSS